MDTPIGSQKQLFTRCGGAGSMHAFGGQAGSSVHSGSCSTTSGHPLIQSKQRVAVFSRSASLSRHTIGSHEYDSAVSDCTTNVKSRWQHSHWTSCSSTSFN